MADQASHVLYAILRGEQYEDEEDVPNQPAMSPTVETDNEDIDEEIEEDEDDTIFDIEEKSSDDDDEEGEEEEDGDEDDNVDKPSTSEMKSAATNKENRMARQCVICGKRVIYLAHHIARQHRVKDKGRRMRLLYQSRQIDPIRRSKEPQYKRRPRDCIVPGCHAKMLIRLDNHLVAVHKLKRGSPMFSRILMETRIKYDDVDEKPEKMSINESYSVFDRAGQHLLLIAGGGASAKKTVYNHVLQMKKISEMAGGVKELFTNSSRLRNIMTTMQKTKAPKTIMKYLESVKKLGTYMMIEEEEGTLLGITQPKLAKTERLATALIKGLRPLAKKRERQMKSQIRDKMIDATDIQQFCMMLKKETKPHITRLSKGEKVSWNDLLCVRNYLITELLVAGAPRSGVITGFTLQQFRKATKLTKDDGSDYWVANVDDHKTATSHGPARLVFNDEVYSLARVYADYGRVQTANVTSTLVLEDDSPFFLENKGGKVTRVAQTIFRLWKSHGFAGNLNPTHIRYTAATKACETLNPVSKRGVATLMAHTVATQEHYYNALQADNAAVDASMLVRQSICQPTSNNNSINNNRSNSNNTNTSCADHVIEEEEHMDLNLPKRKGRIFSWEVTDYLRENLRAKMKQAKATKKGKTTMKDIVRSVYNEGRDVLGQFSLQSVYDKVRHGNLLDHDSDEDE